MATACESDCSSASSLSLKESCSESEILEQASLVKPYSNESLVSSGDEFEDPETDDEDGISSQTLAQRYDKEIPVDAW